MLVLTRKLNQKVIFPALDIAVQVVELQQGQVRLGIEAPRDITVLREEVLNRSGEPLAKTARPEPRPGEESRAAFGRQLCDRMRATGMSLGLLRLLLDAGQTQEAAALLAQIQDDFQMLRRGVEGEMESSARHPVPARKHTRALLVEDDRGEREMLAEFLRRSGLKVDTAGDGSDALDYLRSHDRPDVVLLDMGLPRVDGPTTVREIRRDPAFAGIKIIGVTGRLPEEFNLELGPRGIDEWFRKPFDPQDLLHHLNGEAAVPPSRV
jgi:carbon storage regulator CsrA